MTAADVQQLTRTSITQATELGQKAGLGLHQILAHSTHRNIAPLMTYVDEHDRQQTQSTLADLVATALSAQATGRNLSHT